MKRIAALLVLAFATTHANAGLFSDDDARKQIVDLQTQVSSQDQRIQFLEAANKRMLDLVNQLEQLKQDLATLRGQNETLQYNLDEATKRQKDLYVDLDTRVRTIEQAKAQAVQEQQASNQQSLDAAIALAKGGKNKDAVNALTQFIQANPDSAHTATAQYWLGVSQTGLKNYKAAQAAYGAVLDQAPDDPVAPDALYGRAVAANAAGDKKGARAYLLQLLEKYPSSDKAAIAKKALLTTN
ncbi:YbgF trimerization domain-containing protein [Silvimonas sp.]|uniref:YbgF trimerization domain-containing protein n=1 Tax=Silvimonas sp. TaxID=2650811 RepID=UPI0028428E2F|nr:YbgF trimerization domain-containing protein [Silvimonas sp.]MDR3429784.1 YbgF trimerization domain-containing protein [Silvimonas sp.]